MLWQKGDRAIIDGVGPDGLSQALASMGKTLRGLQTGYVYHYAFMVVIAAAALLFWFYLLPAGVLNK
jgi:NADH-quinone oxidoreductase subunit L